jgi:hypothetical protein
MTGYIHSPALLSTDQHPQRPPEQAGSTLNHIEDQRRSDTVTRAEPRPPVDPASTRRKAAVLLSAAARNELAGPATRLHCLTALNALGIATGPGPASADRCDPDQHIMAALRLLGSLPSADFAQPDVLEAARWARRALREQR